MRENLFGTVTMDFAVEVETMTTFELNEKMEELKHLITEFFKSKVEVDSEKLHNLEIFDLEVALQEDIEEENEQKKITK